MSHPKFSVLAASAIILSLAATGGAVALQAAGTVSGRVTDESGRPIAGAEVSARYQSNGGGVSYTNSTHTDASGRYSIRVGHRLGAWSVSARAPVGQGRDAIVVELTPDRPENFAANAATVRNFSLRFTEQTADNPYGDGGMLVAAAALMDYTEMSEVEMTLRPANGGPAIVKRLRQTGEGYVITGLRPQRYTVTARINGSPLLISPALSPSQDDYEWGESVTGGFENRGAGIYQLRVEVKGR